MKTTRHGRGAPSREKADGPGAARSRQARTRGPVAALDGPSAPDMPRQAPRGARRRPPQGVPFGRRRITIRCGSPQSGSLYALATSCHLCRPHVVRASVNKKGGAQPPDGAGLHQPFFGHRHDGRPGDDEVIEQLHVDERQCLLQMLG